MLGLGQAREQRDCRGTKAVAPTKVNSKKVQKGKDNGPIKITKIERVRFRDKIDVGGGSGGDRNAEFYRVRLHIIIMAFFIYINK